MQEQMDRMVDSLHQSSSEDVAAEILAESSAQQNRKNVTKTIRQVYKEETGKDAEIESLKKEVKRLKAEISKLRASVGSQELTEKMLRIPPWKLSDMSMGKQGKG